MTTVATVAGPIELSALGNTLAHEHVIALSSEFAQFYPEFAWSGERADLVAMAAATLERVRARGIDTIIDCTAFLHGRDLNFVRDVAQLTAINIVASTGIYTYDYLPDHIAFRRGQTPKTDILTRMFVRDITRGIADSGVRAQHIKIAVDRLGFTENVKRVFRAAGAASSETGAPITVHTHPALHQAAEALDLLTEHGADAERIVMGHSGDSTDVAYLRAIADAGAIIGCDRFGLYTIPGTASEDERISVIAQLVASGYENKIVLAHDTVLVNDWHEEPGDRFGGDTWVPTHLSDVVIPKLFASGVTEKSVRTMLRDVPASLFSKVVA